MKTIHVLLADDHELVRAGIHSLLRQIKSVKVVGEAGDGEQAITLARKLKPQVVLMDIAMPKLTGLEATAWLKKHLPEIRVLILSMHTEQEYVLRAIHAGAAGYLMKGAGTAELELAVMAAARGQTYLCPQAAKHVVNDVVARGSAEPDPLSQLTARQRQVLQLTAAGCSRKQIADKFTVSVRTIDTYRAQLMSVLDIHDTASLVRFAIKSGLSDVNA